MDITSHKAKLEEEQVLVRAELSALGTSDTKNPLDWSADADASTMETADLNVLADADETQEVNKAIVNQLEVRLKNIQDALVRIETGTYGICTACNTAIEPARLDTNPAAATCIKCA